MKSIGQISEEVLRAWSEGANTTFPDRATREPWMREVWALAELVQQDKITVQDIFDYTKERCSDPWQRKSPQLWSIRFVRSHIVQWVQVRGPKDYPPPDGYHNHIDHLGFIHTWDRRTGQEVVSEQVEEPEAKKTTTHGTRYVPSGAEEVIIKRYNTLGYTRSFYMDGFDQDMTPQEIKQLRELAGDHE